MLNNKILSNLYLVIKHAFQFFFVRDDQELIFNYCFPASGMKTGKYLMLLDKLSYDSGSCLGWFVFQNFYFFVRDAVRTIFMAFAIPQKEARSS